MRDLENLKETEYDTEYELDNQYLYTCRTCGALVSYYNLDRHSTWHQATKNPN